MLLLACCVAVGLGKAGLYATCALVVALCLRIDLSSMSHELSWCVAVSVCGRRDFMRCSGSSTSHHRFSGPALSIVGELQQARAADQGVIAMLGGHRMPGLLKLLLA